MDNFKDLAKPDKLLNPTYVQGDAHQGNIFYDEKTDHVTFIDNERIARTSPKSPFLDIQFFIFTTIILFFHHENKNFLDTWLHMCIGAFLWGYIRAYDTDVQNKVLDELIVEFNNPEKYEHSVYYEFYKRNEKIFNDIFDFLKKAINKGPITYIM